MGGMSNALATKAVTDSLAGLYLALCEQPPTAADTAASLSEVGYPEYQRVAVPPAAWGAVESGRVYNVASIVFTAPGAGRYPLRGWALCAGNEMRWWGALEPSWIDAADGAPKLEEGRLVLEVFS
jgi:hypothetical protein